MTRFSAAVAAAALVAALPLAAPVAHAADPSPAVPAARYSLDTPITDLVTDAKAKAVLDTDLPGLTSHPRFEEFKIMSLAALAAFAPNKLTPERLAKVRSDLATIR